MQLFFVIKGQIIHMGIQYHLPVAADVRRLQFFRDQNLFTSACHDLKWTLEIIPACFTRRRRAVYRRWLPAWNGINSIMLRAGIVGLPNVGKSTLFNAVTRTRKAEAANYPFCTIDPNVGIVTVPDARLEPLSKIAKTQVIIPAAVEFVDIAGLVKGASQGEGLGNKFLSHIREVDANVQVVRCFEDPDIHHVAGSIDPIRDIETIVTELVLADLDAVQKRLEKVAKDAKRGDKVALAEEGVLKKLAPHLNAGKPAITLELAPEEKAVSRLFWLMTDKPTIFACNVKEGDLAGADQNPFVGQVRDHAKHHFACEAVVISAQIESDLIDLSDAEAREFLKEL